MSGICMVLGRRRLVLVIFLDDFCGFARWSRASHRERVNLTTRSRESVLDRYLNMFVSCVVDRRMVGHDIFVRWNGQPNMNLKTGAVAVLVAWRDHGYATCRDVFIVDFQPFDFF